MPTIAPSEDGQCALLEKGVETLEGEPTQRALDDLEGAEANILLGNRLVSTNVVQNLLGEPGDGLL